MSAGNPERGRRPQEPQGSGRSRRDVLEEQLKKEKELVAKIREKREAIEKNIAGRSRTRDKTGPGARSQPN